MALEQLHPNFSAQTNARTQLSIAVSESKYLGKWLSGKSLVQAKKDNIKKQLEARQILLEHSNTVWYPKNMPTKGNNFRSRS